MVKKKYDLIFSLGEACSCTQALRNCNLQLKSYPFDWLFGSSFSQRIDILLNDFDRFIDKKDLEFFYSERSIKCDAYKNTYNKLVFNHDFPANINVNESYDKIKEKYDRRITRLLKKIDEASSILIVYLETPDHKTIVDDEVLIECHKRLLDKYNNKDINILCISNDSTYKVDKISQNIKRIYLNYKDAKNEKINFSVDFSILNKELAEYKLNIPLLSFIKIKILKLLSSLIIIKPLRKKFIKKYHIIK